MRRFLRIYRLIRELQVRQAFVSMTVLNHKIEFEVWDGFCRVKGDEYTALRVLRSLKENERRGLEWATKSRSGRTAA